jgi:TonB family protein
MRPAGPSTDSRPSRNEGGSSASGRGTAPSSRRALDRGSPLLWASAIAIVLTAHAAALYAMTREPDDLYAGSGGQVIDAISVTMVASDVLEARDQPPTPTPSSAAASVDTTDGTPAVQREEKKEEKEETKEKPREEPVREAEAVIEVPQEKQQQEKQVAAVSAEGGETARSERATESAANAAAAASPGVAREYSRYVTQALAKTKPKGTGTLGTVRVKLTIAANGDLTVATVTKSSGITQLDELAISAVRRTRFPSPPTGMTAAQLTFEVPYHFR